MRQSGHDSGWAWFRAPRDKWDALGISPVLQAPNQRTVTLTHISLTCVSHALGCPSWDLAAMPRHLNPAPSSNYISNKSLHITHKHYGVPLYFIPLANIEGGNPYEIRVFWGAILPMKNVQHVAAIVCSTHISLKPVCAGGVFSKNFFYSMPTKFTLVSFALRK